MNVQPWFEDYYELERSTTLPVAVKASTFFQDSKTLKIVTEATPVSLRTTLSTLAMLTSFQTPQSITSGRTVFALSAENFTGQLNVKDHAITHLRKILAEATGNNDGTIQFGRRDCEVKLKQDETAKTTFPTQVAVVEAEIGQVVVDQMFSVSKYVDLEFLSIEAYKPLKRIAKQYKATTQREAWIEAVAKMVATFVRENRPRAKETAAEEELVQKFLRFDPIFLAPGARTSDAIQRLQEHVSCYCNVAAIWYSTRKIVYVVWDSEFLL